MRSIPHHEGDHHQRNVKDHEKISIQIRNSLNSFAVIKEVPTFEFTCRNDKNDANLSDFMGLGAYGGLESIKSSARCVEFSASVELQREGENLCDHCSSYGG
jgi:hypothetical protein